MLTPTQTNSNVTSPVQPISVEQSSTSRTIPPAKRVNPFEQILFSISNEYFQ